MTAINSNSKSSPSFPDGNDNDVITSSANNDKSQLHYFDHFAFEEEEEEEEDTSSDGDDEQYHLDAQIDVASRRSDDVSSVTSTGSADHSSSTCSSNISRAANSKAAEATSLEIITTLQAPHDHISTDETPLRHNSNRQTPASNKRKKTSQTRISEREFGSQIQELLSLLRDVNGTSSSKFNDVIANDNDDHDLLDLASSSFSSSQESSQQHQPSELDLALQDIIQLLQRHNNDSDVSNAIEEPAVPSSQQFVNDLIKSLDDDNNDDDAFSPQQPQESPHYYLQAFPSGESKGLSAMYDDPMTSWQSNSIISPPSEPVPPPPPPITNAKTADHREDEDDDTALKLYSLLKDFDTELETVQVEQELSRSATRSNGNSATGTGPVQLISSTPSSRSRSSISSTDSSNAPAPRIPHPQIQNPPMLRRTTSSTSAHSDISKSGNNIVDFSPPQLRLGQDSEDNEERESVASNKKSVSSSTASKPHTKPVTVVSAFIINSNSNDAANSNNIPTPIRSNISGASINKNINNNGLRQKIPLPPKPERLEDSDEEISVRSYGSKSSLKQKMWGKKKKKNGDMQSVGSSTKSKSKLLGGIARATKKEEKRKNKVRLLEAADMEEEDGEKCWKDPFGSLTPQEQAMPAVVEALNESASGEENMKIVSLDDNASNANKRGMKFSKKSVTTSDTYVPENNKNRTKLSWGELQVAGFVKTSSFTDMDSTAAIPVDTSVKGGTNVCSSKPTLIDSDGFLFSEDNAIDEDNKNMGQNSPFFSASFENSSDAFFWTPETAAKSAVITAKTADGTAAANAVDQVMTSTRQRIEKLRAIIEEKSKVDPEAARSLKVSLEKIENETMNKLSRVRKSNIGTQHAHI